MSERTGRPRRADLDAALVEAAGQILLERGFEELSVDGLVKRARTTTPATASSAIVLNFSVVATSAYFMGESVL